MGKVHFLMFHQLYLVQSPLRNIEAVLPEPVLE
jgi:hypothetical protein